MKALIVEPSRLYHALYAEILNELGFDVVHAENGQRGFESIDASDIDLVIISMHLGDMNGASFCERMRKDPRCSRLPVVMITSTEDRNTLGAAISSGVTVWHRPPIAAN